MHNAFEAINAIVTALGGWGAVATGVVAAWTALQEVRHRATVAPIVKASKDEAVP